MCDTLPALGAACRGTHNDDSTQHRNLFEGRGVALGAATHVCVSAGQVP
jgi:hypothetical protein